MANALLRKASTAFFLLCFSACAIRTPKFLYTFEIQADLGVLGNFPHNCLRHKTSIEMVESRNKAAWEKNPDWVKFKSMAAPNDEIWTCSTEHPSIPRHSPGKENVGHEGLCIIRNGKIIAIFDCFTVEVI